MSQATVATTDSGASSGRTDSLPVVAAKFLLPSAAGTVAWLGLVAYLESDLPSQPPSAPSQVGLEQILSWVLLASVVCSVLVAAAIHLRAPAEYADRFHQLGVHLTMFVSINAAITTAVLLIWLIEVQHGLVPERMALTPMNAIWAAVMSSIFLPGPYAGALIGRWWSN
ncbi:hypothetical protein [Haloarcula sp. JP-L23]|uniref:hypothetical protein n=1 Tax=Haloarcula sp. JP-L23 TaxID=2716717 RepID=UPI00140EC769|nr:hypothetical protein G9465_24485 [Haloarcula sp. JP-L23]